MRKIPAVFLSGFILLLFSSVAQATLIDFTSRTWEGISGNYANRKVDEITVELETKDGNLTWNNEHGNISSILNNGLAGIGDGIGISDDEVSLNQTLTVHFSPDVIVSEIFLLDLFSGEPEYAHYSFDDNVWTTINGSDHQYGLVDIITGSSNSTSWIKFQTADGSRISDYAVAGMIVNSVPEPATMFLFGTALVGLASCRIRRKKKA